MLFFTILGALFIIIGIWSFFSLRKSKRNWTDFLLKHGLCFDQQNQLVRPQTILLNFSEKQQLLWARGTNNLNDSRPDSGVEVLHYAEVKSFKAEINHQPIADYSMVEQLLSKATIVKMEINNDEVNKLIITPDDLADKTVRLTLAWWLLFLRQLARQNGPRDAG